MVELITNVNNAVNGFVWGVPMLVLLVGTGILNGAGRADEGGRPDCRRGG